MLHRPLILFYSNVNMASENRIPLLKAGARGVSEVVFSSIFHEQTQSNQVCCFPTL